jgi:hypothetical protein
VNPNLINQLELNQQINDSSHKFKMVTKNKWAATQRELTREKGNVASTHLGQLMLQLQDKDCILAPYNFK